MSTQSLQDLYVQELQDLYSAENQILQALPKMAEAAYSEQLRLGFNEHLQQTQGHVQRLQQIFDKLGENPAGETCKGMQGLIQEGEKLISEGEASEVRDAGLIASAQKVEHYEMAGYGSVRTWARELGDSEAVDLLQQTLDEEGQTDQKLTTLATKQVNREARQAA
jgi:ferritin-like metal-binding protein YciE